MKEFAIDGWEWNLDDETRLTPWFNIRQEVEERFLIASTDTVKSFRVQDSSRRSYVIKHIIPNSLKEHLFAWFSSKAEDLYNSSVLLRKEGIPCAEYPGWGKNGTESMVLSVEIPDTVNALEYWFRIAPHDASLRREFVTQLSQLVGKYASASVTQDNFNLEHILVKENGSAMFVINPEKARVHEDGLDRDEKIQLLHPFAELRGEISAELLSIALFEAGVASDSQEISELLHEAVDEIEAKSEEYFHPDEPEKIMLDENGPLFRTIREGEKITCVRNTIWHAEIPMPDDTNSIAEEIPHENAVQIWCDSFKAQLLRTHCARVPLSWEIRENGMDVIRYAATDEGIQNCGFSQ